MTEKELNSALIVKKKLDRLQGKLEDFRETGGVGASGMEQRVKGGLPNDVFRIVTILSHEVEEMEKEFKNKQRIVRQRLEEKNLSDEELRVMKLRYVECLEFKYVADLVGYTQRHIYRFHRSGIERSVSVS